MTATLDLIIETVEACAGYHRGFLDETSQGKRLMRGPGNSLSECRQIAFFLAAQFLPNGAAGMRYRLRYNSKRDLVADSDLSEIIAERIQSSPVFRGKVNRAAAIVVAAARRNGAKHHE